MKNYWKLFIKLVKSHYKILISLFVFFILGIFSLKLIPAQDQEILFQEVLKKMAEIETSNDFILFLRIWGNNALVLLIGFVFSFLYFPVYLIEWLNGLVLSLVAVKVLPATGYLALAFGILPHGIIELSVFFLASWLSLLWWTKIYRKDKIMKELSRWQFTKKIAVLMGALIIFLALAALIEVYLTPLFLSILGINI